LAFRPVAVELALKERLQRHLVHHLDRHLVHHRPPVQRRRLELPVVQVRSLHFEPQVLPGPQALRLHVELDHRRPPVRPVRLVLRPGRNQWPPGPTSIRTQSVLRMHSQRFYFAYKPPERNARDY
jgi:hypothetical protein